MPRRGPAKVYIAAESAACGMHEPLDLAILITDHARTFAATRGNAQGCSARFSSRTFLSRAAWSQVEGSRKAAAAAAASARIRILKPTDVTVPRIQRLQLCPSLHSSLRDCGHAWRSLKTKPVHWHPSILASQLKACHPATRPETSCDGGMPRQKLSSCWSRSLSCCRAS
jgi:hypothetical protein